jgi:hypothetical protein
MIQSMWFTGYVGHSFILRIYWDDQSHPSVEAPVSAFFGSAYDENFADRDNRYPMLNSSMIMVAPGRGLNCYWTMPFRKRARVTIENRFFEPLTVYYQIDYALAEVGEDAAYFCASFRRENPVAFMQDYTIIDGIKGKGQYVGTYLAWQVNNCGWWGEGEIKFFMDGDTEFPTICGTGTEDYICGAYNFDVPGQGYTAFSTPYSGLPQVIRPDGLYRSQMRFGMYRWHITDPIYFKEDIRITIQALGWRSGGRYLPLQDDISSVAFWYQDTICKTFPKFPTADELEIN